MVNHALFGLDRTTGWHLGSLGLHLLVCALAYALLVRLRLRRAVAFAIVLVFSVHPSQVESVAWVSGSPNLLMAAGLLSSLFLVLAYLSRPALAKLLGSVALFSIALLSKETAALYPFLLLTLPKSCFERASHTPPHGHIRARAALAGPYFACVVAYLLARTAVLGRVQPASASGWSVGSLFETLPSVLYFYLRQIAFPFPVAASYPLRRIEPVAATFANVVAPLILSLLVLALLVLAARKLVAARIGLAIFACALLPAMNLPAFHPEILVHDRYLYVPILGFLIVVVPPIASIIERVVASATRWPGRATVTCAALLATGLAVKSSAYSAAWAHELDLWEWTTRVDPISAFNQTRLASLLRQSGRLDEAKQAIARAVAVGGDQFTLMERAIVAYNEERFQDAEQDLRVVIETPGVELAAFEQLGECLLRQGRAAEAIDVLKLARDRFPHFRCRTTASLVVYLVRAGRIDEVLGELEGARSHVNREYGVESRRVLLMLGHRYAELGRFREARDAMEEFLRAIEDYRTPEAEALRSRCNAMLTTLPR